MGEGWQPDPAGRHQERYFDGGSWTDAVRDRGIENRDEVGRRNLVSVAGPAAPSFAPTAAAPIAPPAAPPASSGFAPPVPSVPHAPLAPAGSATVGSASVSPPGPPPAPVMASASSPFVPADRSARRGIPFLLALSVVLATFPAIAATSVGALAVLAGNDISDSSYDSYDYSSDYSYDGSSSDSFDVEQFGADTNQAGLIMVAVGGAMLLCALLAAMGNNFGRVITAIWLVAAAGYLISRMAEMPDGAGAYLLVFIAPPVLALIGLFAPASNAVFRGE